MCPRVDLCVRREDYVKCRDSVVWELFFWFIGGDDKMISLLEYLLV